MFATILRQKAPTLIVRTYISRAHPKPSPEFAITHALQDLLDDIERRQEKRLLEAERNKKEGVKKVDETIEISVNLNLDPKKPGQALRGSVSLPHGSGKTVNCIVLTSDESLQQEATKAGALHVGGADLVGSIKDGTVPIDFERTLATPEMMDALKPIARLLGPRGLMPNPKSGTLLPPEDLIAALETQRMGREVPYRTDREGIVHLRVGKGSFGLEPLLGNVGAIMKEIFAVKPEQYGKGKKVGKGTKYLLKAAVSSTQGPGIRVDLRTLDPSSAFFLKAADEMQAAAA